MKYTFMRSSWRSDVPLYLKRVSEASVVHLLHQYVQAGAVEAMLAGDVLPEGSANLITLHRCQYCFSFLHDAE